MLRLDIRPPGAAQPDEPTSAEARRDPGRIGSGAAPRWTAPPPPRGERYLSARAAAAEGDAPPSAPAAAADDAAAIGAEEEVLLARTRLLEQLTRAADQGLLTFEGGETGDRGVYPSPDVIAAARASGAESAADPEADAAPVESPTPTPSKAAGGSCLPRG